MTFSPHRLVRWGALLGFALLALALACDRDETLLSPGDTEDTGDLYRRLARQVSEERLMDSVRDLTAIHSRYMHWDPGTAATLTWLQETLTEQGNSAHPDSFSFWRLRLIETANVEVVLPGRLHPGREVQVGAHWDCIVSFQDSSLRAPGADDNASGVAALVEVARILQGIPLANTVRLVFFAGEEIGFKGSNHLVDRWREGDVADSLICMINVDMIGHDPDVYDATFICNDRSAALAATALAAARPLPEGLALDTLHVAVTGHSPSSDHYPFWYNDLPAFMFHEGPGDALAGANSDADSLSVIVPEFLTECTRALLGAVLRLAEPLD
jgi:hypothetical protein